MSQRKFPNKIIKRPDPEIKIKTGYVYPGDNGIQTGSYLKKENIINIYENQMHSSFTYGSEYDLVKNKLNLLKKLVPYNIEHEKWHKHNCDADINLCELNFMYRYSLKIQDELSAKVNDYINIKNNNEKDPDIILLHGGYTPNNNLPDNLDTFDMLLSASIAITEKYDTYWNQFRSAIYNGNIKLKDNVTTPLKEQKNLYEEMINYYFNYEFNTDKKHLLDTLGADLFKYISDSMLYVFAAGQTVTNPGDPKIIPIIKERAKEYLIAAKKLKSDLDLKRKKLPKLEINR